MPKTAIVLGAGIVGAAIAWQLARRGIAVTVIDRAPPGSGASARSFGWINANRPATAAYYALRREAIAAWARLGADLPPLRPAARGGIIWEAGDWSAAAEVAALNAHGDYGARVIGRAEIAALEPALADPPAEAVLTPLESAADGAAAARILLAAATDRGVRCLIGAQVTGLLEENGRIAGLRRDFGEFRADVAVVAAGVACGALLSASGLTLPMDNRPGLILQTAPVAPCLTHVVLTPEVHMRQEPDGRIVAGEVFFGEGPNAAMITRDPAGMADLLIAALARRLPGVTGLRPRAVQLGIRPMPADGFPALGPLPGAPGLWLATMHSGITLAPLVGELLAAEIATGAEHPALAPYRPARFA